MNIVIIENNKKDFLELLLLADEQESMIDKYLERGVLFALYDGDLKSICVVTDEGSGVYEIQSLATYEQFQGKGYGKHLVGYVCNEYKDKGKTMLVGTGDVPWIVSFYERCGFTLSHRLENYFIEHYDEPMFDAGVQLKDKVYLKMDLQAGGCNMKCLIITGSPSKKYPWGGKLIDGFTGQLVAEVQAEMQRLGDVTFEEIRLSDINLPYCKGCYSCFVKGEENCPHAAMLQPAMQKMREADCLILTSPVYALNVSALVKGFFDLGAYNHHRPSFHTKKALVVSSTAGGFAKKVCGYMRDELLHWGFNRVYTLPVIRMGAADMNPKMRTACRKAAKRLYNDAASGKLHSPAYKQVFYYQLWRNMSKNDKTSADYKHWHESDLGKNDFAPVVRLGICKRLFGKVFNGLFGRVMKNWGI
jgi:multimeric flavodoxin WrbA/GNAT superfamily N-acetyltransferase